MQPHGRSMFQSTHSLRSATGIGDSFRKQYKCFNPRTPCGVRQMGVRLGIRRVLFQSTHSLRSATALADMDMVHMWVSIHALLAECDGQPPEMRTLTKSFNPRTPCGVRQNERQNTGTVFVFQSTHSLRSATGLANHFKFLHPVSIHALLAECDRRATPPHK